MNAHPIDTEALRNAVSGHGPDDHGPGICDQYGCFTSCVECGEDWPCLWSSLPDVLAAAEHRATRAEAQSAIRGRAVAIYRERARVAEDEVKRLSWRCGHLADKYETDTEELRQEVDQVEARIKAVLAVLDKAHDEFERPDEADIRRALTT